MKTTFLVAAMAMACALSVSACGKSGAEPQIAKDTETAIESPGSCSCSEIEGKCSVERNKCKKGFKPRCIDLGDECDCECVQK